MIDYWWRLKELPQAGNLGMRAPLAKGIRYFGCPGPP
jgi:hypothetical protein